jgi:hypothetical protein
MQLTTENLVKVLMDCLYDLPAGTIEPPEDAVIVRGVIARFGFDPKKLEKNKDNIATLLACLPEAFSDGGWSFLNACQDRNGVQWGGHRDIDELICLGLATKQVEFCTPRETWSSFPGGVPYFRVLAEEKDERAEERPCGSV